MDPKVALRDFLQRVKEYEAVYEPVGERGEGDNVSYLKLFNVGQKVVINRCYGFLVSQIVSCLQNFHINNRRIFLCRHGESEDNLKGRIGGDSVLTEKGQEFAEKLCDFILELRKSERQHEDDLADNLNDDSRDRLMVTSSMLRRAMQTAAPLRAVGDDKIHFLATNQLNEISAGKFEGMTYKEIEQQHPDEFRKRSKKKLLYRYPMGESYVDMINRLNPLVLDMERLRYDVLVVCHQGCARALLGYFLGTPAEQVPYLEIPLHTVMEISPGAFKCKVTKHKLL
jgi:broad specificity phosphatase PhoE